MRGRTVILVSHHVQLCAPEASYIVALDNGRLRFAGGQAEFRTSGVLEFLSQAHATDPADLKEDVAVPDVETLAEETTSINTPDNGAKPTSAPTPGIVKAEQKKAPKRLIEEEKRAVGHIRGDVWTTYLTTFGGPAHWFLFVFAFSFGAINHVLESGWMKYVLSFILYQWRHFMLEWQNLVRLCCRR